MSTLQKRLKRPETYLFILSFIIALTVVDLWSKPENQITAKLYVGGVQLYQLLGRPLLEGHIKCRYKPSCSEYSIEAVRKYGIPKGFVMTVKRVNSCTTEVPMRTLDPLP
jgi:putative component of membrane protein insertase Oxa1/YidC/SpoIIIJ protein YidD